MYCDQNQSAQDDLPLLGAVAAVGIFLIHCLGPVVLPFPICSDCWHSKLAGGVLVIIFIRLLLESAGPDRLVKGRLLNGFCAGL